ncbi:conserved protein, unknown function, partial [Hepatocystis sp. ex Piliocolobus tephrosceles]
INISNFFYVFISICQFANNTNIYLLNNTSLLKNKNNYCNNKKLYNLLYIIYTVRLYRYNHVYNILNDVDLAEYVSNELLCHTHSNTTYNTNDTDHKKTIPYFNLDKTRERILNEFALNDIYMQGLTNEHSYVPKYKHSHNLTKKRVTLSSFNFISMFLNTYLDCTKFNTTNFLIILFYANKLFPLYQKKKNHLESRLYENHKWFINKFFTLNHCHNYVKKNRLLNQLTCAHQRRQVYGCSNNSDTRFYKNKGARKIAKKGVKKKIERTSITLETFKPSHTKLDQSICKHNIYDNIEYLFKKNKNKYFGIQNTINFCFLYSMNKFYYS